MRAWSYTRPRPEGKVGGTRRKRGGSWGGQGAWSTGARECEVGGLARLVGGLVALGMPAGGGREKNGSSTTGGPMVASAGHKVQRAPQLRESGRHGAVRCRKTAI